MSRHHFQSAFLALCVVGILSAWSSHRLDAGQPVQSPESQSSLPDFQGLFHEIDSSLAALTSPQDMGKVFVSLLASRLGLNDTTLILRSGERALPPTAGLSYRDVHTSVIRLVSGLNRWRLALGLRSTVEADHQSSWHESLATLLDQFRMQVSIDKSEPGKEATLGLIALTDAVVSGAALPQADHHLPLYDSYRQAVETRHPLFVNGRLAWLPLLEEKGAEALRTILLDGDLEPSFPEDVRTHLARQYFDDRLLPYLAVQLASKAAAAEQEASLAVVREWAWQKGLRGRLRETLGLKRLCGTWQWVVHDHRNHSDSKTIVTFGPTGPDGSETNKPAEVVVMGDGVYLRWEYGGSQQQEDSLLFVGEGQRLEGSFVNTAGSWGNITGKRLKSCKPEGTR
ncbi:MAG: hypothetical protein NW703_08580 [Nitrospiraceae bacterium]